jgi:hypothetical protein
MGRAQRSYETLVGNSIKGKGQERLQHQRQRQQLRCDYRQVTPWAWMVDSTAAGEGE